MSNVFFTADTHFGHARTLALSRRPYASVAEMDAALIDKWNAVVGDDDEVYHLGDVADIAHPDLGGCLQRLRGRLHLILGNNDDRDTLAATGRFASVCEMREVVIDGQALFLCHYPLRDWPHAKRGVWHLFGHVHGRLNGAPLGLSLDVGIDSHGYAPVAFGEVARTLLQRAESSRAVAAE